MTSLFSVALMGAGAMGTIMARDIYPQLRHEVAVTAIVDRHPDRAKPLADALGARVFGTLREAAAAERLDGVDIRIQHVGHSDAGMEAIDLGLHVLVEKPLATTLADCVDLMERAGRSDRTVAVAENYPHLLSVRAAAAAIADGRIGELLTLRSTRAYTLDGPWAQTAWRQGPGDDAGILWDQGTHHTSMLRMLGGEVVAVAAHRASGLSTLGSEVVVLDLEFATGGVGQSLYCWGSPRRAVEVEAQIWGTGGSIEVGVSYSGAEGAAVLEDASGRIGLSVPENYYDSHRLIVEDWISAARSGTEPVVGLKSATADVRVVLAARASLAAGGALVQVQDVQ